MISKIINKVYRKIIRLIFQPIRVFCFHHVCEKYDEESMYLCDWMSIKDFKQYIYTLRDKGYQFISLTEAYNHLMHDFFRKKKYAVITFDDGFKSILEIIPWLISEKIPVTLFINGKYLDGMSYRENSSEQYIDYKTLFDLNELLIEIGHHGWEHIPVTNMDELELIDSISKNINLLSLHSRYIPFWAYTYGIKSINSDKILVNYGLIPVMVNGGNNINKKLVVEREPIFSYDKEKIACKLCKNVHVCKKCVYNL